MAHQIKSQNEGLLVDNCCDKIYSKSLTSLNIELYPGNKAPQLYIFWTHFVNPCRHYISLWNAAGTN